MSNRPVRSVAQGFDKLGKAALASFLQNKDVAAADAKETGIIDTFRKAAAKGFGSPEQSIPSSLADVTPGTELVPGGGFRVPAVPPDKQAFINALLGNRDTARFGAELGFQDIFREPQETFTPVYDSQGNIVGQRNSLTSEVTKDPRAPKTAKTLDQIRAEAQARAEGGAAGGKPPAPSVSRDFVLPLLQKRMKGEQLTPDERAAFDLYTRTGVIDQLLRDALGGAAGADAGVNPFASDETTRLRQAREALAQGAPRAEVERRLRTMGVDPSKL